MAIKVILMALRHSDASEALLETGLNAARRFDAHLRVLYARANPDDVIPYNTLGLTSSVRRQVREAAARNADEESARLRVLFDAACARAGIEQRPIGSRSPQSASVEWVEEIGARNVLVEMHGRLADLIIVPCPSRIHPPPASFESALRGSGRAVIMVPRGVPQSLAASHVAIAWNGSAAASKAIAASGPCLAGASRISVLTTAKRAERRPNADEVVTYLACHGLQAKVHLMDISHRSVGVAMLQEARALGVDLLVAGGYSRNRFRAMVFGGVTEHLLAHADLPVLMMT